MEDFPASYVSLPEGISPKSAPFFRVMYPNPTHHF